MPVSTLYTHYPHIAALPSRATYLQTATLSVSIAYKQDVTSCLVSAAISRAPTLLVHCLWVILVFTNHLF
jgi:hypothetical protein